MATIASLAGLMGGSDAGALTPGRGPQQIDSGTGSGGGSLGSRARASMKRWNCPRW